MANRLARETSPYLLQHAENPVDWYPWGKEALARARELDRPILLSIGYSACHWCHVMERESFEDPATAGVMNEAFVSVKVDREERPDLDAVYMRAVQAVTGQGGWPLTVFLTPEGVPWYGGTYFPPEPRHGMPSFQQVLRATQDAWAHRREEITRSGGQLLDALRRAGTGGSPEAGGGPAGAAARVPEWPLLEYAVRALGDRFDAGHGGFGQAPKFPQPPTLEFLLRVHGLVAAQGGDGSERKERLGREALQMATHTLRQMARGGIRDHLGGGFHRYSVDARWLVPHFEKMLYDNALLARLYVQAWQLTEDDELRGAAESTLDWLLDDMRDPEGGFHSARDADSGGEEGLFYVWTPEELEAVLGPEDARLFARLYDVAPGGNFEGRSILHLPHDPAAVARAQGLEPATLAERVEAARKRLLEARSRREPPLKDDKVLAAWNGMTLRALAEAGGALDRPDYVEAAARGMDFLLRALRRDGRLLHVWKGGEARVPAFLDDHGAVGNALLTLHEATLDPRWLPEIRWACEEVLGRFWEEEEGVFYDSATDAETLVVRPRETMDNATPSGNSLAVELLLRAGRLFGEDDWIRLAGRVLAREGPTAERYPTGFGRLLSQVVAWQEPPVEVAIVGRRDDGATRALHAAVLRRYLPGRVVAGAEPDVPPSVPVPLLEGRRALEGRPTAYVCRNLSCREPVTDPRALERQLQEVGRGTFGLPGAPS